jgi:hypothetical protein
MQGFTPKKIILEDSLTKRGHILHWVNVHVCVQQHHNHFIQS